MLTKEEKQELLDELKRDLYKTKKVYIEVCRENVKLPKYANEGDAGMDIRAAEDVIIMPKETKMIPTGLKIAIPKGYEIQVRPRSGLSLNTPLRIPNAPGTIDSGYRDEVGILITNTSNVYESIDPYSIDQKGNKNGPYIIRAGDRIAQFILCKYERIEFETVDKDHITTIGINRGGGFGSTGIE